MVKQQGGENVKRTGNCQSYTMSISAGCSTPVGKMLAFGMNQDGDKVCLAATTYTKDYTAIELVTVGTRQLLDRLAYSMSVTGPRHQCLPGMSTRMASHLIGDSGTTKVC